MSIKPLLAITAISLTLAPVLVAQRDSSSSNAPRVLQERIVHSNGRTIIMRQLDGPPKISQPDQVAPEMAVPMTPEELEKLKAAQAKPQVGITLFVTRHENGVTRLKWQHEKQIYEAFSNIDFRVLPAMVQVETETTRFLITPLPAPIDPKEESFVPALSDFTQGRSEFLAVDHAGAQNEAYHALEALHSYYDAEKEQIRADHAVRVENLRDQEEAKQKAGRSKPKTMTLNFWAIEAD